MTQVVIAASTHGLNISEFSFNELIEEAVKSEDYHFIYLLTKHSTLIKEYDSNGKRVSKFPEQLRVDPDKELRTHSKFVEHFREKKYIRAFNKPPRWCETDTQETEGVFEGVIYHVDLPSDEWQIYQNRHINSDDDFVCIERIEYIGNKISIMEY